MTAKEPTAIAIAMTKGSRISSGKGSVASGKAAYGKSAKQRGINQLLAKWLLPKTSFFSRLGRRHKRER